MSFTDPYEEGPGQSGSPPWLNVAIVAVYLICGLVAFVGLSDNATYFGFDHGRIIDRATAAAGILTALAMGRMCWQSNSKLGQTQRLYVTILVGGFAGFLMGAMTNIIATRIDRAILFPPSRTETFANVEAPIGQAYVSHGKHTSWVITLPQVDATININQGDYMWMLAKQRAADPAINSDHFYVAGKYCVQLTVQTAGQSGRLLDSGYWGLSAGSVHICPPDAKSAFARATQLSTNQRARNGRPI